MLHTSRLSKRALFLALLLIVGLTAFTGRQFITMAQRNKRPQSQQNGSTCTLIQGTGGNTRISAFGPNLDPTIKKILTNSTNNPAKITVSLNCSGNSTGSKADPDHDNDANGKNNDHDRDNTTSGITRGTDGDTDDNSPNGQPNDGDRDNGGSGDD
jgi:hypothetical protein